MSTYAVSFETKGKEYYPIQSSSVSLVQISTATQNSYNPSFTTLKPLNETTGLEFIFTIGLEGTGHHLMSQVISNSPAFSQVKSLGLENFVVNTVIALFQSKNLNGLFNQACQDESIYIKEAKKWKLSSKYNEKVSARFDTVIALNRTVNLLRTMQQIYDEKTANNPRPLRIPLNSFIANGTRKSGMISYPNFRGKCYKLQYPILDLLYKACSEAKVQCSHVYVYRHPLDVLTSTTVKRKFNPPGMVLASHLYTSHLKIMESQLLSYPDRNRGCFGFFDQHGSEEWQALLRDMWGWTTTTTTDFNVSSFASFVRKEYRKPTRFYNSTSTNIVSREVNGVYPAKHIPYLEVFLKAHERTLEVCRQTAVTEQ
jgi:hypothetical protein